MKFHILAYSFVSILLLILDEIMTTESKSRVNLKENIKSTNWSKKLYVKTDLPDNFVDDSFLESKRINGNLFKICLNLKSKF